jgi:RNA recognition motif-containing protein
MRLYIGNLPYKATEADLESWFSQAGIAVDSVNVVRDRFSGEARGFGFAEIANDQEAARAISTCNGKQFMGRPLVINEARPMASGGGAGAGGGGGMGRGPRGGGGGSRRERY